MTNVASIVITATGEDNTVFQTTFTAPVSPQTFIGDCNSDYTELAVPVPIPDGVSNLPPFVYFDVNNQFTAAQRQRIKDAISGSMLAWATHMDQKWNRGTNNGISRLASCANTYATQNFQPVWYHGPLITNGLEATNLAMDQFTQLIRDNGFRLAPPAKIDYQIPSPVTSSTIRGETGFNQNRVPLSFIINPTQLDPGNINSITLTGSMFHAWLHRAGFQDPKTTSYFISEAPMCVMRGNQPKSNIPDPVLYQFFD
ncbi:hypothetical protein FDZ14_00320 (plasmid) [Priestia megaterium]|uniref:Uncharacterized protein n=1 Tax=Priestia megaterium TaxID=1404 RepID=A0A6M6DJA8_PRIMG|nr:hypothetical protein FDZ14_00320 [Priestia megaterium]